MQRQGPFGVIPAQSLPLTRSGAGIHENTGFRIKLVLEKSGIRYDRFFSKDLYVDFFMILLESRQGTLTLNFAVVVLPR
jgi:hypothetical protein